ncbi:MAG: hypothetical protein ACRD0E_06040, partial [Acidimicrobiales bacterium]
TDYDTGLEGDVSSTAVTARSVLETLDQVVNRAQELIAGAIDSLGSSRSCKCSSAPEQARL